jgi:hypothetical protein
MKKILTPVLLVLPIIMVFLSFTSCEDDNNNYNYDAIEPGKQLITGPDSITGNGVTEFEFVALARGGSKYAWTVLSGPVVLRQSADTPHVAFIKANASTASMPASIMVVETTEGGKTGTSDTINFKIMQYCQYAGKANFTGKFRCKELVTGITDDEEYDSKIIASYPGRTYGGDTLLITRFCEFALEVKIVLSGNYDQKVTIIKEKQVAEYGEGLSITYEVEGEGTYDNCTRSLYLTYKLYVDGSYYNTGMQIYTPK